MFTFFVPRTEFLCSHFVALDGTHDCICFFFICFVCRFAVASSIAPKTYFSLYSCVSESQYLPLFLTLAVSRANILFFSSYSCLQFDSLLSYGNELAFHNPSYTCLVAFASTYRSKPAVRQLSSGLLISRV